MTSSLNLMTFPPEEEPSHKAPLANRCPPSPTPGGQGAKRPHPPLGASVPRPPQRTGSEATASATHRGPPGRLALLRGRQAPLREGGGFATASEAMNIRAAPKEPPTHRHCGVRPSFGRAGASIRKLLAVRKRKKSRYSDVNRKPQNPSSPAGRVSVVSVGSPRPTRSRTHLRVHEQLLRGGKGVPQGFR